MSSAENFNHRVLLGACVYIIFLVQENFTYLFPFKVFRRFKEKLVLKEENHSIPFSEIKMKEKISNNM